MLQIQYIKGEVFYVASYLLASDSGLELNSLWGTLTLDLPVNPRGSKPEQPDSADQNIILHA